MSEDINRFERTLALNTAAESLGLDPTTRKAMTHVETLISALSQLGLTWNDIPEKFSLDDAIRSTMGEVALKDLCAADPGLELTIQAQHDSDLRATLLGQYVQCIEVAIPGEVMTIEQTIQALLDRE